jgi:hypothetical protein
LYLESFFNGGHLFFGTTLNEAWGSRDEMQGQIVFDWSDVLDVPAADYTETWWNPLRFALRYELGGLFCQNMKVVMLTDLNIKVRSQ